MDTEQEWQFSAAALDAARTWLASLPTDRSDRRLASKSTLELTDTYYDSPDWMIFRAGFALRLRQAHAGANGAKTEVTLKSLSAPRNGIARRTEISERFDDASMETVLTSANGIGQRIRELIGERALRPLFKANTRRERRQLLEADSELPLAEVDLDETCIEAPSGVQQELKRVEVECLHATPEALQSFVEQLREAAQLAPVAESKFRAGLNAAGLRPEGEQEPVGVAISASQPFAQTQFALLRRYFAAVMEKEPLVRAGSVAAVHDMRVAARHLDVLLRNSAGYGPRWATGSHGTLNALIKALGSVRDRDVQLEYLLRTPPTLEASDRESIEPLRQRLTEQHERARVRLLQFLDSSRMRSWMDHWLTQLREDTGSSARARRAITADVASKLIRSAARKLRKRAERVSETSDADALHEVRIRAKRLRYTLDAFGPLYGDVARDYVDALAKLQNVLGEFHDFSVRAEMFAELVTRGRRVPAATTFLVGRLVERDRQECERCRRRFAKAYRRIRRRRWRALAEAMDREMPSTAAASPGEIKP